MLCWIATLSELARPLPRIPPHSTPRGMGKLEIVEQGHLDHPAGEDHIGAKACWCSGIYVSAPATSWESSRAGRPIILGYLSRLNKFRLTGCYSLLNDFQPAELRYRRPFSTAEKERQIVGMTRGTVTDIPSSSTTPHIHVVTTPMGLTSVTAASHMTRDESAKSLHFFREDEQELS